MHGKLGSFEGHSVDLKARVCETAFRERVTASSAMRAWTLRVQQRLGFSSLVD